jgi:hypothetical protein
MTTVCLSVQQHGYGTLHYYGFFSYRGDSYDVDRVLTKRDATRLNEQDEVRNMMNDVPNTYKYKAGQLSNRFDSAEDVVNALGDFFKRNGLDIDQVINENEEVVWQNSNTAMK